MTLSKARQPSALKMSYRCDFFLRNVAEQLYSAPRLNNSEVWSMWDDLLFLQNTQSHIWAGSLVPMGHAQLFKLKYSLSYEPPN